MLDPNPPDAHTKQQPEKGKPKKQQQKKKKKEIQSMQNVMNS